MAADTLLLVDGAREMMGVVGMGKATLKCGRESAIPNVVPDKLPRGERLSGEALGGVSGAYEIEVARGGALAMLMMDSGGLPTFEMFICELTAIAVFTASSFWEMTFSK